MTTFTKEEKNKYLKVYFGSNCPKCGDEDIEEVENFDMQAGDIYQQIRCNKCKLEWYDVYRLVNILPVGEENEND